VPELVGGHVLAPAAGEVDVHAATLVARLAALAAAPGRRRDAGRGIREVRAADTGRPEEVGDRLGALLGDLLVAPPPGLRAAAGRVGVPDDVDPRARSAARRLEAPDDRLEARLLVRWLWVTVWLLPRLRV
jgi:hypothetical protein